jgi:peptide/nickel transport system substrate-binding protein
VRFDLYEPVPDFMAFYGTMATGAGWIVPKNFVEKVGPDGFKKNPIGLGPYKFVSHTPGIELVMEAKESYWRKVPSVKRLVYKVVPEPTTRVAMLKRGEVDVAYLLEVPQAQELKRDPNIKLAFSGGIAVFFLDFLEQWDPKSPWHDKRVRLAASYALDRQALSDAETLGASKPAGNFIPRAFDFALPLEPLAHNPARAKQLLAEAGYPNGFDAGELHQLPPSFSLGEAIIGNLQAVAIKLRCGRWSAPRISRRCRARSSRASASARAPSTATPPRGCRRSIRAKARMPTAAIRTSTPSTSSKGARRTGRSARRSCTRSSSS